MTFKKITVAQQKDRIDTLISKHESIVDKALTAKDKVSNEIKKKGYDLQAVRHNKIIDILKKRKEALK